jgi:tetratricopeptide (TPR) repeat protein
LGRNIVMLRKIFLLLLLGSVALVSKAQIPDSLFNKLADFDLERFNNNGMGALRIGEQILPDSAKIPLKTRTSFFDHIAKLYEDQEQDAKAIFYYEKVAAAAPDYYVVHRALGYLYEHNTEDIQLKLNDTKPTNPAYKALFEKYKNGVLKALPHLEKAQACDPDDETLDLIRTLYQNIHDKQGLNSLGDRLTSLRKNCVDILSDN